MTIATAYWCVLVAALLPYVWTTVAKASGERYDNRDPRGWVARQSDPRVHRAAHDGSEPIGYAWRHGRKDVDQRGVWICDLHGVEGYEGLIFSDHAVRDATEVDAYLGGVLGFYQALRAEALFADPDQVILTAGGSAYYDLVAHALSGRAPGVVPVLTWRPDAPVVDPHAAYYWAGVARKP